MTVTTEVLDARASCQAARSNLGAYIRAGGLSTRVAHRVTAHLECCRPCRAIYLELIEVDHHLRGLPRASALGAVRGFLQTRPGKALLGTTAAGVVVAGLVMAARPANPKPTPVAQSTLTCAPSSTQDEPGPAQPTQHTQHPGCGDGNGDGNGHEDPPADKDSNEVNVAVTASRSGVGSASMVTVNVTGLSPTQSGVVTITTDQPAAALGLDPRCDLIGVRGATCRISGSGRLEIMAGTLPLTSTTLTITATPGEGLHDKAMGDNTARIILDGRV